MLKRKKIGPSRTESPANIVGRYVSGFFFKIIFCVILGGLIYLIFNYFIFNFINFMLVNVSHSSEINHDNPYFMGIKIFAVAVGIFIVLKDTLRKR